MTRAPTEEPHGLVYRPELISVDDEARLRRTLELLRFDPIVLHGITARRTARHFGLDYDYGARTPQPGEPVPDWLLPLRARAAELAGVTADALVEVLVQRYPPGSTIGWHRDAPAFGTVVGVSLLGSCRLRFQRGTGTERRVWEVLLAPRSGYVLTGAARSSWQHAIPETKELRYSITFRTLRRADQSCPGRMQASTSSGTVRFAPTTSSVASHPSQGDGRSVGSRRRVEMFSPGRGVPSA